MLYLILATLGAACILFFIAARGTGFVIALALVAAIRRALLYRKPR